METQHPKIKPLLSRSFCIKNLHRYKTFLLKRPKTTFTLKFLQNVSRWSSFTQSDKWIQTNLHKALKLLKSVRKLDLSEYGARDKSISQAKLLSIFKRVSKAKAISIIRVMDLDHLEKGFTETWLRYLPHILYLNWGLTLPGPQWSLLSFLHRQSKISDPLRYLKYCPKIESLKVNQSERFDIILQQAFKFKRYPLSLKKFDSKGQINGEQINNYLKQLQGLKSLSFTTDPSRSPVMNTLSQMSNLQEIDLQFIGSIPFDTAFEKISQRGVLKKIQLEFDSEISESQRIFQALKTCPLTYFSLKVISLNDQTLKIISNFLENMSLLETLKLSVGELWSRPSPELINKQVGKLQNLRYLELSFKSQWKRDQYREVKSFIPDLPIKLETFHFECAHIDPTKSFDHLITLLEGSYDTLRKLTLILENHAPFEESRHKILAFLKKLHNVQELRLPFLKIASVEFISKIARTVQQLKCLRTFQIGKILNQIIMAQFLPVLGKILRKIGLREFYCFTEPNFLKEISIFRGSGSFGSIMDVKQILKVNPYLERVDLSVVGNPPFLFYEIDNW